MSSAITVELLRTGAGPLSHYRRRGPRLPVPKHGENTLPMQSGRVRVVIFPRGCASRGVGAVVAASETNDATQPSWFDRLDSIASGEDTAPNRMRNRPSKSRAKRKAHQSHDMAAKLSELTENQLALLEPMLDDDIIQAVKISARIDGKNQGRRRQEQLIGKLLREYPGPGLDELETSINAALSGASVSPGDAELEDTALAWREALVEGDKDVEASLCELAVKMCLDTQQFRTCITSARKEAAEAARRLDEAKAHSANAPVKPAHKIKVTTKSRKALLKTLRELAAFQQAC
mmetsp:Transcript_27663/g.69507  ORF Transcript_27663/g.69507 Transcript_27663/m.69507 type:complete len:291 (-) Transcript_27663:310-1182(-)